jgi:hypothetical protein
MPLLLLAESLSHLTHPLFLLFELLFNLGLESSELNQLLFTLWQELLVFGIVFD